MTMRPLPWRAVTLSKAGAPVISHVYAADDCGVALFNGYETDTTLAQQMRDNGMWPLREQGEKHERYALHCANHYPALQALLAELFDFKGMPKEASEKINALLQKTYLSPEEIPPCEKHI